MEAMYIHAGNRNPKTLLRIRALMSFEYFLVRGMRGNVNSSDIASWSSMFYDFKTDTSISLEAEFDKIPKHLSDDLERVNLQITRLSADHDDFVSILREFDSEDEDDVEVLEFLLDESAKPFHVLLSKERVRSTRSVRQNLLPSVFLHTGEPVERETNIERFSNMRQSGTVQVLIDALKVVEPRLEGLEILFDNIHANVGLRQLISLSSLGDGMNRTAGLILAMHEKSDGIVFIDEIENGIHHTVQCKVWQAIGQLASDLNIQVFATTHSLEMIRAAYQAFSEADDLENLRLHRLDRDTNTSDIHAVTYNKRGLEALAAFDFDFEVRG